MNEKISIILSQSIGSIEDYSLNSNIKNFSNWDSMNHMILITRIESEFDIQFTGDEIAELKTVGCILNLVKEKILMNNDGSIIITGCNSGIGEYLTRAFVKIGHTVFGLDKIKNETNANLENGNFKNLYATYRTKILSIKPLIVF